MKCFKQARPSLCGSEWKHNIRGHQLRNLQAEKIHAREITLNCTEQWRESALEATRSLGKHCVKDTLETYLHECSAQSLRKAACTGIPPLRVLKCFHYEPGLRHLIFFSITSSVRTQEWNTMSTYRNVTTFCITLNWIYKNSPTCLKPNKNEKHCVLSWSHCVSM